MPMPETSSTHFIRLSSAFSFFRGPGALTALPSAGIRADLSGWKSVLGPINGSLPSPLQIAGQQAVDKGTGNTLLCSPFGYGKQISTRYRN
jgi:hypothetical protein